ncbi:MAG: ABC transporter substrate-binding protein, partial [Anaerolineae bacterium]|nr:ABC transporter substrate-binding protein [Anaerolineae bacterium]
MFNKIIIIVCLIGIFLIILSGCSSSVPSELNDYIASGPSGEHTAKREELSPVIKIGVNETMTGWGAHYGDITWKGIRLAHKYNPEVLGRPVELILLNNKSEVEMSARVAQRLVEQEQVHAVLGVNSSSMAIVQNEV